MDRINSPASGDRIRAKWASDIVDQIRRLNIIPGNGIRKTVTSKGVRIDVDVPPDQSGGGGVCISDVIPCIVSGGTAESGYSADLYANGLGERRTGSGTLWCPELATHSDIPSGSSILAHVCLVTFTQSDENGEEVGPEPEGGNS